jgi:hypothetical protein
MGLGRVVLAVAAAGAVVTLLVIGGRALFGALDTPEQPERQRATTAAATPSAPTPTVRIQCVADTCPMVTVRVPGGDVLQYRDMSRGEEVSYFQPELDVVLTDAASVRVTENGKPRPPGKAGRREAFTVRGPGA